jgi:2-phosphosulfolactate phosphatase
MRVETFFLPSLFYPPERYVCVVIDVLRATSTLATLAARGVPDITVVETLDGAFALQAERENTPLLCGEVGGFPPEGFDHGNSPDEFSRLDLAGRSVVLFTSNGTRALVRASGAAAVFAGALLNRTAVVTAALAAAEGAGLDLAFVCSGTDLGRAYCLEDAYCAGALVAAARAIAGETGEPGDGAETAQRLYESYSGDAMAAFAAAEHGRTLARIGLAEDLAFCARTDLYAVAPRLVVEDARVIMRNG